MCIRDSGITAKSCKTRKEAWTIAEHLVSAPICSPERLHLVLLFQNIPREFHGPVLDLWRASGCPPLAGYAPYAAHVLKVDTFFYLALAAGLISDKPSNRMDIAYLYYLPFCHIFVSYDKLHRDCAPFFLRPDQEFVWGGELKTDLKTLNRRYQGLPDETKAKGIFSFASRPPKDTGFLVSGLWDRHWPRWRDRKPDLGPRDKEADSRLLKKMDAIVQAPELPSDEADISQQDLDAVVVEHLVRRKKGSWWQVPSDLKE